MIGAFLLLHLPEKVFVEIVPVLLVLARLVVLGPRIQAFARARAEEAGRSASHVSGRRMIALVPGTFAVGIYGGYFTAAQGNSVGRRDGALLPEDIQRMNAAKNLLSLLVNVVAAVAYATVAFDRISWAAAGLIAVGSLLGGFLGPTTAGSYPQCAAQGDRGGGPDRAVSAAGALRLGRFRDLRGCCGRLLAAAGGTRQRRAVAQLGSHLAGVKWSQVQILSARPKPALISGFPLAACCRFGRPSRCWDNPAPRFHADGREQGTLAAFGAPCALPNAR